MCCRQEEMTGLANMSAVPWGPVNVNNRQSVRSPDRGPAAAVRNVTPGNVASRPRYQGGSRTPWAPRQSSRANNQSQSQSQSQSNVNYFYQNGDSRVPFEPVNGVIGAPDVLASLPTFDNKYQELTKKSQMVCL